MSRRRGWALGLLALVLVAATVLVAALLNGMTITTPGTVVDGKDTPPVSVRTA